MKKFGIVLGLALASSPAVAQSEPSLPTMAPLLGDIGLAALAIGLGLGGAWGIGKFRGK